MMKPHNLERLKQKVRPHEYLEYSHAFRATLVDHSPAVALGMDPNLTKVHLLRALLETHP